MRHGRNSCSGVLMYTSPSVLQCARTVTIGLFRKTGWPDRAWWLWSSTTTTSLTNFTSLGVIRPENRGEIVSVYNLQWVVRIPRVDAAAVIGEANPNLSQSEAITHHCHSRTGPTVPLGQRTGPSVQRQLLLPVPSIILAGSPPVSDCAAGPLRCGSWGRRIPG